MTPISVLHIDSSHQWGGGQNQVRLLMRGLAVMNVRQLCICPRYSMLAERLKAARLPVLPVKWYTASDPRALVAIARTIAKFDVVHCHDAHALQLAVLPAKLRRVPIVAARRVPFRSSPIKWNRADRVVAISETVRASLLRSGIDKRRIRVIHSGADAEETRAVPRLRPSARSRFNIREGEFIVGNAAAFNRWKRHILIPEAAALLPDVQWLIAGDGPMRPAIEAAIQKYNVTERVHLMGWLEDARALFKELDAYVSTAADEALGNSIIESLALRVPVVATEVGGPAEILRSVHAQTGAVLYEPGNARALADTITKLRVPGVRQRVIELQDARFADYSIERTVAATLELYNDLLNR